MPVSALSAIGSVKKVAAKTSSELPQWGNLSKYLIANIYPVKTDSSGAWIPVTDEGLVQSPLSDFNIEYSMTWQSPFENSGIESKAPALMAMIQTGQISQVATMLQAVAPSEGVLADISKSIGDGAKDLAKDLEGRTGITKLNSRQVFSGMPPISLSGTLHFRAIDDPVSQVSEPIERLLSWALPQELASDAFLTELVKKKSSGSSFLKAMFPSMAPMMIGFTYARERYIPMVIESISYPLTTQRDGKGRPIYVAINIKLTTLTALDRSDVANIFVR